MNDTFSDLIDDMMRDVADRISEPQKARALGLALAQYGKDRPRREVVDEVLAAAARLPHPPHPVLAVEYPIGSRRPLPASDYYRYETPDGPDLLFCNRIPAGETVRLTLASPHVVSIERDTVPASDREAVVSYTAAILFDQLAAETSGDASPTILADTVNHASKPESYAKRAERLRKRYFDILGLDPKRLKAASVTVPMPGTAADGGRRVTNGRGRRR